MGGVIGRYTDGGIIVCPDKRLPDCVGGEVGWYRGNIPSLQGRDFLLYVEIGQETLAGGVHLCCEMLEISNFRIPVNDCWRQSYVSARTEQS